MPTSAVQADSTLTARYQTTVPRAVRDALGLGKGDRICYTVLGNGEVRLSRAETPHGDDPAIGKFLEFLATTIAEEPARVSAVDAARVARLRELTEGVEADLDAPLPAEDE